MVNRIRVDSKKLVMDRGKQAQNSDGCGILMEFSEKPNPKVWASDFFYSGAVQAMSSSQIIDNICKSNKIFQKLK